MLERFFKLRNELLAFSMDVKKKKNSTFCVTSRKKASLHNNEHLWRIVNSCTYPGYSVFVHSITKIILEKNVSGVARKFGCQNGVTAQKKFGTAGGY